MTEFDETKLKQTINGFVIPPKPQVLEEIQLELKKTEIDLNQFAEIISDDVAMSAAILKTINSPCFGLSRSVSNIKQSVVMLGAQYITTFATQFLLKNSFKNKSSISFEKFWDTSTETANMMLSVHTYLKLGKFCRADDVYAFGMFRDCGIPPMSLKFADYKDVLIKANQSEDRVFTDIEEEHYSTNHAVIGYILARSWHFPKPLCELILRHHETDFLVASDVEDEQKSIFAISKIAANVLNQVKFGQDHSEWLLSHEQALANLTLSDLDYEEMLEDMTEQYQVANS